MLTIQVEIKTITKLGPMWISRSFFSRKERQPQVCICRDVMFSSWDIAEIKAVITLWVRPNKSPHQRDKTLNHKMKDTPMRLSQVMLSNNISIIPTT
jgi:hypothetical protein